MANILFLDGPWDKQYHPIPDTELHYTVHIKSISTNLDSLAFNRLFHYKRFRLRCSDESLYKDVMVPSHTISTEHAEEMVKNYLFEHWFILQLGESYVTRHSSSR